MDQEGLGYRKQKILTQYLPDVDLEKNHKKVYAFMKEAETKK